MALDKMSTFKYVYIVVMKCVIIDYYAYVPNAHNMNFSAKRSATNNWQNSRLVLSNAHIVIASLGAGKTCL